MKRMLFVSIISIMMFTVNASAKGSAASTEAKSEIQSNSNVVNGLIFDKLTKETLAGATITANGQKVYSDLDGNFSISNLCDGKCHLKISLISYVDQTIEIDTQHAGNLNIKLQQR